MQNLNENSKACLLGELPNSGYRVSWRNRPEIMRWCRQRTLLSSEEDARWFDAQSKDPKIKMFGIWVGGDPVGVCGLTSIDPYNRTAEFSLYIGPEHQRKGYARQALTELLEIGFHDLGLNRIWGESFDGNPAQLLFEKIGMVKEGHLEDAYFKQGKFIGASIWAITRKRWDDERRDISSSKPVSNDSQPGVCHSSGADGENWGLSGRLQYQSGW